MSLVYLPSASASSNFVALDAAQRPYEVVDVINSITPFLNLRELGVATEVCRLWHASLEDILFTHWASKIISSGTFKWNEEVPSYHDLCVRRLTHRPSQQRKNSAIYPYCGKISAGLILKLASYLKTLDLHKSIYLKGAEMLEYSLLFPEGKEHFPHLRTLSLSLNHCDHGNNPPLLPNNALDRIRRNCPQLTSLSLGYDNNTQLLALLKTPEGMDNRLDELTILGCRDTSEIPAYSPELISEFMRLERLNIFCSGAIEVWFESMVGVLQECPLVTLDVFQVSDKGIEQVTKLKSLIHLKIHIERNLKLSDLASLAKLPLLKTLELTAHNSYINPSEIQDVAREHFFHCELKQASFQAWDIGFRSIKMEKMEEASPSSSAAEASMPAAKRQKVQ